MIKEVLKLVDRTGRFSEMMIESEIRYYVRVSRLVAMDHITLGNSADN